MFAHSRSRALADQRDAQQKRAPKLSAYCDCSSFVYTSLGLVYVSPMETQGRFSGLSHKDWRGHNQTLSGHMGEGASGRGALHQGPASPLRHPGPWVSWV